MEDLNAKMLKLIDIYYEALDAPKTGKKVMVPNQLKAHCYPHYMDKDNQYQSGSVLGKICDAVETYKSGSMSRYEIWKLPLFEHVRIPDASLKFWKEQYDNYRQEMTDASSSIKKSEIINKYKEILYGAADFKGTSKNKNDIHEDALALYHVCYDYAKSKGDVGKCNFVWKVAGPALCHFSAMKATEGSMIYCVPSVLKEIVN